MSEINVLSRTQRIIVNPTSRAVSVINSGPQGPPGVPGSPGGLTEEEAIDAVATSLIAGDNISIGYDDPGGDITLAFMPEEIIHDWSTDGWTPFTEVLLNDDFPLGDEADQTVSVVAGRGRITNTAAQASLRKAYPRDDTLWMDSEITTLVYGSDVFSTTGTNPAIPQGGHFHRGYYDVDGRWRAIAVSNNIFLSDVNVINANVWNMDPTEAPEDTLDLGTNGGAKSYSEARLLRVANIYGVARVNFFGVINTYYVTPANLNGLEIGTPAIVDTLLDSTFDIATAQAIANVGSGLIQMIDAEAGANVTAKPEFGIISPPSESARRWWPYWLKSRLIGSKLSVKAWRQFDPEPDWSDPQAVNNYDFAAAAANDPAPGAMYPDEPGYCGLVGNHIRNTRYFEYGYFSARKL